MSGLKEKTWKKWKESKTTSPVAVTNKKTTDSISSQRSSSLIRSRKRQVPRDAADNILAAESQEIITPRTPIENEENERVTTNEDHSDAEEKNDFRNKSTSPFNTLAPTNPFYRENVMIVQYGELDHNKPAPDTYKTNELWSELPSAEVVESPKAARVKGPKGGSKRPAASKKSKHKPNKAPPASPTNDKPPHPVPQQTPTRVTPQTTQGPSVSYGPPPRSGQSEHPRTSPSYDPETGTCDFPECPARGPKQKERLCMAPECPVTLKKAVIKDAKKAMKRSSGKKRKNPLTILGAVLMSTFAGHDSSCKLTKEEKRALKRMKQAEEDEDDDYNETAKTKKSKGVQCKVPTLQRSERTRSGPEKANKSTTCDIPECPIATQKIKIKEFMDKGQLCDIPSCPVKEPPPPRKEKKVEPPKGCPSKPCTLKTKDEEFLKQLDPRIFEKLPRLKMTCEQALADETGGQSRPHQTSTAIKNKDKDKGVTIVAAHVNVSSCTENPFLETISNPQELTPSNKLTGRQSEKNRLNSDRASECQKIVDRHLFTPADLSEAESNKFECTRSRSFILHQKDVSVIKTEGGEIINRQAPKIQFSNVSADASGLQSKLEKNERIESRPSYILPKKSISTKSLKIGSEKSSQNFIKLNHTVDANSHHLTQSRLMTSKTSLPGENGFKSTKSRCSSALKFDFSPVFQDKSPVVTDSVNLLPVVTVGCSSVSDAMYNHVFENPLGSKPTPRESSPIKLHEQNWKTPKYSAAPLTELITSEIMSWTEYEPSIEIEHETPIISLHMCQDKRKDSNRHVILKKNTLNYLEIDEQTVNNPSVEHDACTMSFSKPIPADEIELSTAPSRKLNNSRAKYTQTLATSAISPRKLNTISIGDNLMIDLGSEGLGSHINQ